MRRLITFPCAGEMLTGTLDEAPRTTGLLIVSGGNEIRIGAHRGMALLAARVAVAGHPVLRYDRRGIGDSTGANQGFEASAGDIAAAAAAFRDEAPHITRIVAFGNCDAASALALFHRNAGIDALVLTNPWTIEPTDDLPPAAAIRARYAERLKDPATWLRLLRGGIDISKLFKGLSKIAGQPSQAPTALPARIAGALEASPAPLTILLAERDNTAIAFRESWETTPFTAVRPRAAFATCATASHSFARDDDSDWLFARVVEALG
jgi:exosortase A-associated hydrolase 1